MLNVEQAKKYIKVDIDNQDEDEFISELIAFSAEYLSGAGINEQNTAKYNLAQKIIVDDRYTHRGSEEVTSKAKSSLNCIILQLQSQSEETL